MPFLRVETLTLLSPGLENGVLLSTDALVEPLGTAKLRT